MIVYILTISMIRSTITYGYKFLEKSNCEKVGKEITKNLNAKYQCKRKRYEFN